MNVLILGAGGIGTRLARQLVSEGKQVTLIEKDPVKARQAADRLDCLVIPEEGNNLPSLKKAGIERADFFVSVTGSDEINMIACAQVAAEYPRLVTIARVRNMDYSKSRFIQRKLLGIDHVINPEIEAARAVVRSLDRGAVGTVSPFADSGLSMTSLPVSSESLLGGQSIKEIHSAHQGDFLVPLVIRDGVSLIPSGDTIVMPGDLLYIIADSEETERLLGAAEHHRREIKKVAIAGGGRIGRYIADYLIAGDFSAEGVWGRILKRFKHRRATRQVHFIESHYEKGRTLVEAYPQALVTHADISDEEVMEEGILEGYDLLIAATSNQELNLVVSLHAKNHHIDRTIALVRKGAYVSMGQEMGIDVTVSVTDTMVDSILRILRKGDVRSIHTLAGSDFELIDFAVEEGAALAGKAIKDGGLPKDSLILLVSRGENSYIPQGGLVIEVGDRVVIITPREAVKNLEEAVIGS